jgi:hypothetical protein
MRVTPAEFVDLLAIARVKSDKLRPVADAEPTNAVLEAKAKRAEEIYSQLAASMVQLPAAVSDLLLPVLGKLVLLHETLWETEDELRSLDLVVHWSDGGDGPVPRDWEQVIWTRLTPELESALIRYVTLARLVYVYNTQRSDLKRELDYEFGCETEVKHYAPFQAPVGKPPS